jgi:hypothetical protein
MTDELLQRQSDDLDVKKITAMLVNAEALVNSQVDSTTLAAIDDIDPEFLFILPDQPLSPHTITTILSQLEQAGGRIYQLYTALYYAAIAELTDSKHQFMFNMGLGYLADHICLPEVGINKASLFTRATSDFAFTQEEELAFGEYGDAETISLQQLVDYLRALQQQRNLKLLQYHTLINFEQHMLVEQATYFLHKARLEEQDKASIFQVNAAINTMYNLMYAKLEVIAQVPAIKLSTKCFFNTVTELLQENNKNELDEEYVECDDEEQSGSSSDDNSMSTRQGHSSNASNFKEKIQILQANAEEMPVDIQKDYMEILQVLTQQQLSPKQQALYTKLADNLASYIYADYDGEVKNLAEAILSLTEITPDFNVCIHVVSNIIDKIESQKLRDILSQPIPVTQEAFINAVNGSLFALQNNQLTANQKLRTMDFILHATDWMQQGFPKKQESQLKEKLAILFTENHNQLKADIKQIVDKQKQRAGSIFAADMHWAFKREPTVCNKLELWNLVLATQQAIKTPTIAAEKNVVRAAACLKARQCGKIILGSLEILLGITIICANVVGTLFTGGKALPFTAIGCAMGGYIIYQGAQTIKAGHAESLQASASRLFPVYKTPQDHTAGVIPTSTPLNGCN